MDAEGAEILSEEEIAAQLRTLVQAGYETVGCELAVRLAFFVHSRLMLKRLAIL